MEESRTKNSIRNTSTAIICKIIVLVFSFIVRTFFIRKLGQEILGLEGLFASVLSVLNLADLGISTAIIFLLYKPLAENSEKKIAAIMRYFKNFYNVVGIIILIVGFAITPLIPKLVKLENPIPLTKLFSYYAITIITTGTSYFLASRRTIFEASQNNFIVTIFDSIFNMLGSLTKLLVLLYTGNYIYYLLLTLIITFLNNLSISLYSNKKFPYLQKYKTEKLTKEDKKNIRTNMSAVMSHKIGGVLVTGTDNLLISRFIGTIIVGIYSNYLLIINTVFVMVTLIITALTPSVGNLKANSTNVEKDYNIYKKINLVSFWLIALTTICLFVLSNSFINVWVGTNYLFDWKIVLLLCVNYYISTMRYGIGVFSTAAGYFKKTWYKPFCEGIINLIVSIIFIKYLGVSGIFLGTTASLILGSFWIDPVVTYKNWFKKSPIKYFTTYILRTLLCIAIGVFCYYIVSLIHIQNGWLEWFVKAITCFISANILLLLVFVFNKDFKELLKNYIRKK